MWPSRTFEDEKECAPNVYAKKTVDQDYHKKVNNIKKFNIVILSKINLFWLSFFVKAMFDYSLWCVLLIYILI